MLHNILLNVQSMNMKKSIFVFVLLTVVMLAGCYHKLDDRKEKPLAPPPSPESSSESLATFLADLPASCLDYPQNRESILREFSATGGPVEGDPIGNIMISGKVKTETAELFGGTYTLVGLIVDRPTVGGPEMDFYNYFGGTRDTLEFPLGTLEGETIDSTAKFMPGAAERILDALKTNRRISVKLYIPEYLDRGTPPHFSPACIIE